MVALISGGAKGIGKSLVEKFVKAGYKVAFCYNKSEEDAAILCKNINGNSELNCIGIKCDVRDYESVKNFVEQAVKVFGGIDVVVNNAGIANYDLLMDLKVSEWRKIMSTNLDSVFYMCRESIPYMLDKGGSIINISSVWGVYGAACEVAYSASKAGMIGLTKALALEIGSSKITVNCIDAGAVNTDMNKCHSKETLEEIKEKTPLGRIGEPQEVADIAVFLASEKANFITGQVIEVSGGFR